MPRGGVAGSARPRTPIGSPGSRQRRRRVTAVREGLELGRGARARLGRRRTRPALRDTGSARPARLRGGRGAGSAATTGGTPAFVHAVLSVKVNARGVTPQACSRRTNAMCPDRVVADGTDVSRECRTACAVGRFGRCRIWSDATGAVPRSPAGADPSRGVKRRSYMGAALRLASCLRHRRNTGLCRASMLGRSTRSAVGPTDATSIANIPIRATHT